MLENYVIPELQHQSVIHHIIWMQDGAPAYTVTSVRQMLHQPFRDRIIERTFAVSWLPCSPELTPMDFRFWGYLKSKVYLKNSQNLSEFKDATKREFLQISLAMMRSLLFSKISRMQCTVSKNRHLKNLQFE